MKYKKILNFFGEGAEGAAGEAGAEGVQAAAEQTTEDTTPEDMDAKFEAMIKGEYKEQYEKTFQKAFNMRHKDYKTMQETVNTMNPVMDMLKAKYGVQDVTALQEAILNDDSYYEQEAMERGMSVEHLKYMKKMERENAQYQRREAEQKKQEASRKQAQIWQRQEQELRELVPNLDIQKELQNEHFQQMLVNGVDMKTAYQVIHMDEIMSGSMAYAAKQAKEKTVKNIQARGLRPDENGIAHQSGDPGRKTVKDMSGDDILALAEKAKKEGYAKW